MFTNGTQTCKLTFRRGYHSRGQRQREPSDIHQNHGSVSCTSVILVVMHLSESQWNLQGELWDEFYHSRFSTGVYIRLRMERCVRSLLIQLSNGRWEGGTCALGVCDVNDDRLHHNICPGKTGFASFCFWSWGFI